MKTLEDNDSQPRNRTGLKPPVISCPVVKNVLQINNRKN